MKMIICWSNIEFWSNILYSSNPSIEGDTPFQSSESQDEIFCQEISNDPTSSVTTNIKEQLHYDTWREIEQIYKKLQIVSDGVLSSHLDKSILLLFIIMQFFVLYHSIK